jgi:nucleotide-binding universal stress UspA family protein|tara:strand:- start:83 stop:538 length:456 start_codon:yes stop_codon:yes gene_type:complete
MSSKILVSLDSSDIGETVLPHVLELAKGLKLGVTIFQVIAPGIHVHTTGGLDYIHFTEQQIASTKASAKQYLEEVSKKFKETKATVRFELKFGDPAEEIIKFASETDTHLVAMSTHGHSSIGRWTFGSITHKVLHSGNAHVLLVRAPEAKT